ncbi:PIN2/TERF1-interacting telomerase inhibitor 1 [Lobosporangium transversale]|uniref:G-patch domain-containing protein n=1 Tax=Lobosporangium transversale TaxID=64571 RepID=A0A1Y2GKH6_9FUNG|nr:hypothetical protein BCR41DRAFT_355785 [Lobosporangium transversale]KAF9914127.1 PIN2/TERF1-interacting telomerase inhibitor 1 [Lobosporangium transversale]ORZ13447.1 hypothetical protein BCR41DRAFT_355785 [Lobosporangium transversale]|eukprot:XP_021880528.1 hypothetical protein BCR41DRAFT_355785 [Lobosporangium transversale]
MSLKAVRHAKQRLAPDPRNLHWANDTNKFGYKMMEKMGWSQGKGLGAKEDGVQEHVKVRLKENNLGVGATKKTSDNWLGNTDAFSRLLADLNERVEKETQENESKNNSYNSSDSETESEKSDSEKEKKSKKKSRKESKEKKKNKKEKKDKKERKSSQEESVDKNSAMAAITGRKASRHKYLKNKLAAMQNNERLNEILGIKSETVSPATSGTSTPIVETAMTSSDIFAAQLQQSNASTSDDNNDEPVRPAFGGLGFSTSQGIGASGFNNRGLRGLGFVKATVSVTPATVETNIEEQIIVATPASTSETSKEDKKAKKEKKEKKDSKKDKKEKKSIDENSSSKKGKKRKAEDFENSSSKKTRK